MAAEFDQIGKSFRFTPSQVRLSRESSVFDKKSINRMMSEEIEDGV